MQPLTHTKATPHYSPLLLIHLYPQRNYQRLRSLSPSRILLVFHQQAADQLGGDDLSGSGEEGVGEVLGGRGGYGSGFCEEAQ